MEIVVLAIAAAGAYFGGKAYARKQCEKTGYYAFGGVNYFLMILSGVSALSVFGMIDGGFFKDGFSAVLPMVGICLIPTVILLLRNIKLKNPLHILIMTIVQTLSGVIAILVFFLKLILRFTGMDVSSWGGADYQRGREKGRADNVVDPLPHQMTRVEQEGFEQGRNERGY